MSEELLLHQQEHANPLQNEEKRIIHNDIEQEIEYPRCHDIMALSSDFDRLSYVCQECNSSLLQYKRDEIGYESTRKLNQCQ